MTEPTKEARVLAERYRVPDFISLAREIDAFAAQRVAEAVHPWYGPCDALAPSEQCAECVKVLSAFGISQGAAKIAAVNAAWNATPSDSNTLERARECLCGELTTWLGECRKLEAEASDWRYKLSAFVTEILHGDEEHKQWLWDAAHAFAAGEPVPRPGTTERERLEDPPEAVIARGVQMLNTPRSGPDETLVHDIWQAMLDEIRALAEPRR